MRKSHKNTAPTPPRSKVEIKVIQKPVKQTRRKQERPSKSQMVLEVRGRGGGRVDEPGPALVIAPASSVCILLLTSRKRASSINSASTDAPPAEPTAIKVAK